MVGWGNTKGVRTGEGRGGEGRVNYGPCALPSDNGDQSRPFPLRGRLLSGNLVVLKLNNNEVHYAAQKNRNKKPLLRPKGAA